MYNEENGKRMLMVYRKAELSDMEALLRLRVSMLCEDTAHSEEFKTLISNNTKRYITDGFKYGTFVSWVAEQDGSIVAMGGVTFFPLPPNDWCPGGKTAYIGSMYTVPAFRRQGVARNLLGLIVDDAKQRGCERILLNATDKGRPLYEACGFEVSSTAMALYPFGIVPAL